MRFQQLADASVFINKNKRSGEREQNRIVIGMEELVKTLYSFLFGPDDVYGGTGHVFDATKEGGYARLFGEYGEILPTITNAKFEFFAGIWFVCAEAKTIWKTRRGEGNDPALERRWMFFYALGESIRTAYREQGQEPEAALRALSNPVWLKQEQAGPIKKVIGRHCKVAFKSLSDSYKGASRQAGFMHRNWFRSQATITSIAEHVVSAWSLLADHGDDYLIPKPK